MPNINESDHVPLHAHSARDINGLAWFVNGPPTDIPTPTTSGPTSGTDVFADLAEMTKTVTLPQGIAERWQITARFTGVFSHSVDGGEVAVKLVQDGTDVPSTQRSQCSATGGGALSVGTEATVEIKGGTATTVKIQWANITNSGTATAITTQRRLELSYKPLTGT